MSNGLMGLVNQALVFWTSSLRLRVKLRWLFIIGRKLRALPGSEVDAIGTASVVNPVLLLQAVCLHQARLATKLGDHASLQC